MNHIDQEAELYALGMLDDAERDRVDAHLATCDACARTVGDAEAAMAALIDVTQRVPQRGVPRWPLALAAGFAIAALGVTGQLFLMRGQLDQDGTLLATLVNSHFDHTQFATPQGVPLGAKAIYERHGKWFEILIDGTPDWKVVFVQPDGARTHAPGGFARRGTSSVMIASPPLPVRTIELDDDTGHIVGTVHPALQRENE